MPATGQAVDLREYVAVMRRRATTVVMVTAICVATAALYSFTRPVVYTAQTQILVKPPTASAGSTVGPTDLVSLQTEADLVRSAVIGSRVQADLGTDAPMGRFLERVSVEVQPDSLVLTISYTAGKPQAARLGADAFARAYLDYRSETAADQVLTEQEAIQERIDELTADRQVATQTIASVGERTAEGQAAAAERDRIDALISILTARLAEIPSATSAGEVILPAAAPTEPSSPDHLVNLLAGLLLGLILGTALAFVRDRIDRSIRDRREVEAIAGAPVLASIDAFRGHRRRPLVVVDDPHAPASEGLRALRTGVVAMNRRDGHQVFAVTSPGVGEGKTTVCANLGVLLAQAERRVLIISADVHRSRLHEIFGSSPRHGLVDVLEGAVPLSDAIRRAHGGVRILSNEPTSDGSEMLGSERMQRLLAEARQEFDIVLIDCAPVLAVADALALLPWLDATLLVVRSRRTSEDEIVDACHAIETAGGRVTGVVVNGADRKTSSYRYGYGGDRRNDGHARPAGAVSPARGAESPIREHVA